jgi:hypothetical protein
LERSVDFHCGTLSAGRFAILVGQEAGLRSLEVISRSERLFRNGISGLLRFEGRVQAS